MNWVKKLIITMSMALNNVEKKVLSQNTETLESNSDIVTDKRIGTLAHSLINNIITQEVKDLRWRMYKVLNASDGVTVKMNGYDENGYPVYDVINRDYNFQLRKITVDDSDDYKLELVVDNSAITIDVVSTMDGEYGNFIDSNEVIDNDGNKNKTIGIISKDNLESNLKSEFPIKIIRDSIPKFNIENYTKKLHIRTINDNEKLLEFYISKYPNDNDRKTYLLISEIKRAIENPRISTMLDIKSVEFVTYKTIGVRDFMLYRYNKLKFYKITDFAGCYLIKFMANVEVNGEDVLEKYREKELDEKYNNMEAKK